MNLTFLSPAAAVVGAVAVIALLVLVAAERRSRRVSEVVGLPRASFLSALPNALALILLAALVALAAAQPVVSSVRPREGRTDAEAIFIMDISRSMLAAANRKSANRFERARDAARLMRAELPEIPVGVSSLTDRVLPHVFPSMSVNAFTATLERAIAIQRPPPNRSDGSIATSFASLAVLSNQNFFGRESERRLVVLFTDGESVPFDAFTVQRAFKQARISLIFVLFWAPEERVYRRGRPEPGYRPEPGTPERIAEIAEAIGASSFQENDLGGAIDTARRVLGRGPVGAHGEELQSRSLAPYALVLAFLPLGFLLWRRNF